MLCRCFLLAIALLFLVVCQSSVRAPVLVDEAAIKDEIQTLKNQRPYLILKAETESFKEKYETRFGVVPSLVGENKAAFIFLLNAGEERDAAFTGIKIRATAAYPPFAYFDPTFAERLERGYAGLDDLMSGYKDPVLNEVLLAGVVQAYPKLARLHIIGTTGLGRNILALEMTNFSAVEKKIPLLFTGAIHGNELTATEHCFDIIHEILVNPGKYAENLKHVSLWIVPIMNPDGNHFFWHVSSLMGRKNASLAPGQNKGSPMRGVDLNRNFPFRWNSGQKIASSDEANSVFYRGPAPASEKETQALVALAERERFLFSVSFHAVSGKILVPYTIENLKNPKPDYAWAFAREIQPKIRHHNPRRGFRAVKNIYPVDGTDQDFFYFKYGTLAYLIESSYRNCEYRYVPYFLEGYRPLWEGMMTNYAENYKFALQVTDDSGSPVEAIVRFSDAMWFEGERHTSNPRDGSFLRLTKSALPVEVTVSAGGFTPVKMEMTPHGPGYPELQVIRLTKLQASH